MLASKNVARLVPSFKNRFRQGDGDLQQEPLYYKVEDDPRAAPVTYSIQYWPLYAVTKVVNS